MSKEQEAAGAPKQQLTLLDCTCIIVGIIIGAGIYKTSPAIAANVTGPAEWLYQQAYLLFSDDTVPPEVPLDVIGPPALMLAWLFGGFIALVGALCYAELTTTYPKQGGDYVFLTKAYGRGTGFLFVWMEFWIIRPASIGSVAYVFALYANQLMPLGAGSSSEIIYASAAIIALTATNVIGVRAGKLTQNVLTAVKVAGLLAIFATAVFFLAPPPRASAPASPIGGYGFQFAMIMIMYTYGGWNDMSYVAAEVKDRDRNLLRGLVMGTLAVTAIYLLVNLAFMRGLGYEGFARSEAVAADLVRLQFGDGGARAISALICVSCLGAINGMTLTGARIYYAMGAEHRSFGWLGTWSRKFDGPLRSLLAQGLITLLLVVVLGAVPLGGSESAGRFERLVIFAGPFFWLFLTLVGISLFVLRVREPNARRVYRVAFFPVVPALFCASTVFMLYSSIKFTWSVLGDLAVILGAAAVGAGWELYLCRLRSDKDE